MVRMIYYTSPIWHPPHQTLGAQHVTIANRTSSDGGLGGDTAVEPVVKNIRSSHAVRKQPRLIPVSQTPAADNPGCQDFPLPARLPRLA